MQVIPNVVYTFRSDTVSIVKQAAIPHLHSQLFDLYPKKCIAWKAILCLRRSETISK